VKELDRTQDPCWASGCLSTGAAAPLYHRLHLLELLLNIAWLLAVAGIILATFTRPHHRLRLHRFPIGVVVFACIAVVLFPVISASDDLHPASDLSADAAWRHDQHSLGTLVLALLIVIPRFSLMVFGSSLLHAVTLRVANAHPGYLRLDAGRAPPPGF